MSVSLNTSVSGTFENYSDVVETANRYKDKFPKTVRLKLERGVIKLQFVNPVSGKRGSHSCNVPFSTIGVVQALEKANKVADALGKFELASEFKAWYDQEILGKNQIENDLKTYRQIFQQIEDEYFKSK